MQNTVAELGYTMATPIQAGSLPFAMAGRDVIGQAQTGQREDGGLRHSDHRAARSARRSGAGAGALPDARARRPGARGAHRLGKRHELRSVAIYGGDSIGRQMEELRQGAHIVVATPGRLGDHIQRRSLTLANVRVCVLDEADRMLDMGFAPDVETHPSAVPAAAPDAALQRHHARVGAPARAAPHARPGDRGDQHPAGDPVGGAPALRADDLGRQDRRAVRRSSTSPTWSWRSSSSRPSEPPTCSRRSSADAATRSACSTATSPSASATAPCSSSAPPTSST